MRRIANQVAVATLLYTMPPQTIVKIVDTPSWLYPSNNPWENTDASFGLTYTVDEILHKFENEKIARAAIHHTTVNEGMILLVIDTKGEEY